MISGECLPRQQRALRFHRRHLPPCHRRFHGDPAPRQPGYGLRRCPVAEPDHFQPTTQAVADERGGEVEQLLRLAEGQARVIAECQISDLCIGAARHPATSAHAATAPPAAVHVKADGTTIAVQLQLQRAVHRQAAHFVIIYAHRPQPGNHAR